MSYTDLFHHSYHPVYVTCFNHLVNLLEWSKNILAKVLLLPEHFACFRMSLAEFLRIEFSHVIYPEAPLVIRGGENHVP